MSKILAQGAESILYLEKDIVTKDRIKKSYRIKELDEKIRKSSTRRETRILEKAFKLIPVPELLYSSDKETRIKLEFLKGQLLKNIFSDLTIKKRTEICKQMGKQIAILHFNNIIHNDLTTSNMILRDKKLYFIDFGLSFISTKTEDKAVDLKLLKQALESKHYTISNTSFNHVLKGYKFIPKQYQEVINRLKQVEKRGRYKRKN